MRSSQDEGGELELSVVTTAGVSRHKLPARGRVSLGRSEENDVRVDDASVSRRHAILDMGPPMRIEDLGSANGTRVRREPLSGPTTTVVDMRAHRGEAVDVSVGSPIHLGSTVLVVRRCATAATAPSPSGRFEPVVRDEAMQRLYALAERVAGALLSVLLLGETGVGKEILAEHVHRISPRAARPFLRLNCAALSESLLESELFGHEKGAFTGAARAKPGLLETADTGTVFLDEVGELPPSTQVKLLRVLEARQVLRVGGLDPRPIDVRFISATNRDLAAETKRGTFREDLYFRLNGIALVIPPLRARPLEVEPLARAFVARAAGALGRPPPALSPEALAALQAYRWPGNVRELRNVIERAAVLCDGSAVRAEHLLLDAAGAAVSPPLESLPAPAEPCAPGASAAPGPMRDELVELERRRILDALERCAGNQTQAAALLGMPRRTFVSRLSAYGIPRPRKRG